MLLDVVEPTSSDHDAPWTITSSSRTVAHVTLDFWGQVAEVSLQPDITPEERREAVHLVSSHVLRYLVHRDVSNGIMVMKIREEASVPRSHDLLRHGTMTEVVQAQEPDFLIQELVKIGVKVTQ